MRYRSNQLGHDCSYILFFAIFLQPISPDKEVKCLENGQLLDVISSIVKSRNVLIVILSSKK